jgi:hypothetical protein
VLGDTVEMVSLVHESALIYLDELITELIVQLNVRGEKMKKGNQVRQA